MIIIITILQYNKCNLFALPICKNKTETGKREREILYYFDIKCMNLLTISIYTFYFLSIYYYKKFLEFFR